MENMQRKKGQEFRIQDFNSHAVWDFDVSDLQDFFQKKKCRRRTTWSSKKDIVTKTTKENRKTFTIWGKEGGHK